MPSAIVFTHFQYLHRLNATIINDFYSNLFLPWLHFEGEGHITSILLNRILIQFGMQCLS